MICSKLIGLDVGRTTPVLICEIDEIYDINNIDDLFISLMTDVVFKEKNLSIPADSFGFLYSIINIMVNVDVVDGFVLEVGGGLNIECTNYEEKDDLVIFRVGGSDFEIFSQKLSKSEVSCILLEISYNFMKSIEVIGIDFCKVIRKFPIYS